MASTVIIHIHHHELPAVATLAHLGWWGNLDLQLKSVVDNLKEVLL